MGGIADIKLPARWKFDRNYWKVSALKNRRRDNTVSRSLYDRNPPLPGGFLLRNAFLEILPLRRYYGSAFRRSSAVPACRQAGSDSPMITVYALRSLKDGRIYVGMTEDLLRRLGEHNQGHVFSTKGFRPWKVIYAEEKHNRVAARAREKFLKGGSGKEFLKNIPA